MDVLNQLSLARTALDDPAGLPEKDDEDLREIEAGIVVELNVYGSLQGPDANVRYAIDKLDSVIGALHPEDEARALTTIIRLLNEVADNLDGEGIGGDGVAFDTSHLAAELTEAVEIIARVAKELS